MSQEDDILMALRRRWHDLQMPHALLSRRSGVSVSTLKRVLGGEATASLATVALIASALGVHVGVTHAEDVAAMRQRQANRKARTLVALVQGTSALEGQAVDQADIELMEQRTAAELLSGPARRLWGP